MKESKTGRREEKEKNKKRKRKKKKRKREEPRRKVWIYGMDFYDFFWYGSLVLFLEKVWIPFCLDLYGTWYKFVWNSMVL